MSGTQRVVAALLASVLGPAPAQAQQRPIELAPLPIARPQASQVVMPSNEQIVLLVRSALLTLNDALRTGNYTVLHDLAAPGFRQVNPPERLAQIFAALAARQVDLSPVAILAPRLADPPSLDPPNGLLRLKGSFSTEPMQIDFALVFQSVEGYWRLFGITVDARPAATGQLR